MIKTTHPEMIVSQRYSITTMCLKGHYSKTTYHQMGNKANIKCKKSNLLQVFTQVYPIWTIFLVYKNLYNEAFLFCYASDRCYTIKIIFYILRQEYRYPYFNLLSKLEIRL